MKKVIIVFLLTSLIVNAQNLVENPSFEKTKRCVENFGQFNQALFDWSTPTNGTTDLYNNCGIENVSVPVNFHGKQASFQGNNYAGCYFFASEDYREYIQGKLKSTLKRGKKYKVTFYINLSDNSTYAIKNIDFLFSTKKIDLSTDSVLDIDEANKSNKCALYSINNDAFYSDKEKWVLISKEIVAKGSENYISIGNFNTNSETEKQQFPNAKNFFMAYYYLDMISVERVDNNSALALNNVKKIELNKEYILKNVTFSFNSVELSEKAKKEIKKVFTFLKNNKKTVITITGHTDNVGIHSFNIKLSEKRAKVVAEYLISKGIEKERIKYLGLGDTVPVDSNKTEKGRSKNRRVVFKVTQ